MAEWSSPTMLREGRLSLSYIEWLDGWLDGNTKVGFDAHSRVGKKNLNKDGSV